MKTRRNIAITAVLTLLGAILLSLYFTNIDTGVLQPKGTIASQQYDLLVFITLLSLIVIIPVFFLVFFIAWKYRAGNTKATYKPEWDNNRTLEIIWWGIPIILVTILAVTAWTSSHELDPFKPIQSDKKPVNIQVIALDWKWLFIYPEQNIATVNYLQIPKDTPIHFELTSDAPMNSFWIPQLGGQIYAMSGMSSELHLMASETGNYNGVSANLSGEGFADMKFVAKASTEDDFTTWVTSVQQSNNRLTLEEYDKLSRPSHNNKPLSYSWHQPNLYATVMQKYMAPPKATSKTSKSEETADNQHMDMNHSMEGMSH